MSGEHGVGSKRQEAQGSRQGTRVRGRDRVPEKQDEQGQSSASMPLAICSAFRACSVGAMASQATGCPWNVPHRRGRWAQPLMMGKQLRAGSPRVGPVNPSCLFPGPPEEVTSLEPQFLSLKKKIRVLVLTCWGPQCAWNKVRSDVPYLASG